MKKQIILGVCLLAAFFVNAQNSNPWPTTGDVGIGTASPSFKLDVVTAFPTSARPTQTQAFFGARSSVPENSGITIQLRRITNTSFYNRFTSLENGVGLGYLDFNAASTANTPRAAISFGSQNIELMRINQNGKVRIGNGANDILTPDGYKLFVEDGILTEKVKVAIKSTVDWSDYVFEPDYELLPLGEVKQYTIENKHLPNMPSAKEMVENGLDVAKMDAKLLEKIEELTLYLIEQQKQIEELQAQIKALQEQKQ